MNKAHWLTARILILLLALSAPTYAWNSRGHMMVAAVAYKQLTPAVKDRVEAILLLNPDRPNWVAMIPAGTSPADRKMMLFMIAATWPTGSSRTTPFMMTDRTGAIDRRRMAPLIAIQGLMTLRGTSTGTS
jgi:hypothetical protein